MSTISYSMRPKTNDVLTKKLTKWENPAPNKYSEVNMEPKTGRYLISKFSDSKLAKINPNSARFNTIKASPGPNEYHRENDGLTSGAKFVLSNYKAQGTRAFSQTTRFGSKGLWPGSTTPGPGQYRENS
jgi:hypothetical protein